MGAIVRKRGPFRRSVQKARRAWRRWRADVHLISYPKCGRTWLVLMIGRAIQQHYGLRNRNLLKLRACVRPWRNIPYILQHHDGGPEFLLPEELPRDKSEYRGRKVIFMVRDPRDVLVSSYFQKTRRNLNYEGTLEDYVRQRRGGIETITEFYNIWANNRYVPDKFLMIRYEDLHANPSAELRRVMDFSGLGHIPDPVIAEAAEYARFDNMRKLESSNALGTSALAARDRNDEASFKTRKGEVGGYREHLRGSALEKVNRVIDEQLDESYSDYRSPVTSRS